MRSFFILVAATCFVGSALATQAVPNQGRGFKKLRRTAQVDTLGEGVVEATNPLARVHVNW